MPAQHWSGRGFSDRNRTLWGGFVVETPAGGVYFAGDTGYGTFLKDIKNQFGAPKVALLPIGAYEPRYFMQSSHMNPADAVQALQDLDAEMGVGIHFDSFFPPRR